MKKVLFATTALVASAGFAAADVALSGSAEMGIIGGTDRETQFHTDIDVTFTMSGETDNGLTFGASIDLDESDDGDAFDNTTQGGETIFISGGPHTFTMGDTDGAFDRAVDEVPVGGDIDSVVEHAGYSGNSGLDGLFGGQIARYDYAFDAFEVSFSVELLDDDLPDTVDVSPIYGLGASYEFGDFEVGVGYQFFDWSVEDTFDVDAHIVGISGAYTMGDITIGANYSTGAIGVDVDGVGELDVDYMHYGIGAAYSMDAWTFAANWGAEEYDVDGLGDADATGYGLAIHYDLGGGAVIQFGYGYSDDEIGDFGFGAFDEEFDGDIDLTEADFGTGEGVGEWSFGVSMSF